MLLTSVVEKARPSKHEATIQRLAPKMSRAFETAALAAQRRIDLDVLAANIEAGRVGRVLRQLDMDAFVTSDVVPTINFIADAYEQGYERGVVAKADDPVATARRIIREVQTRATGGPRRVMNIDHLRNLSVADLDVLAQSYAIVGSGIPRQRIIEEQVRRSSLSQVKPPKGSLDFKTTNPKALAAAERQAADLLTSVNVETKQTVRDIIARAYREQVSPRDTAKLIRDVVGLNDRQANALFNYRAGLVEDGRDALQVERMTERYGNRLLRQRADTIAQTEIHRASATGQHDLWREGVREGYVNAATARRIWIANAGACEWCEGIEALNADGVEIDGQFETPSGDMIDGPEDSHVGCRCSTGLKTE